MTQSNWTDDGGDDGTNDGHGQPRPFDRFISPANLFPNGTVGRRVFAFRIAPSSTVHPANDKHTHTQTIKRQAHHLWTLATHSIITAILCRLSDQLDDITSHLLPAKSNKRYIEILCAESYNANIPLSLKYPQLFGI